MTSETILRGLHWQIEDRLLQSMTERQKAGGEGRRNEFEYQHGRVQGFIEAMRLVQSALDEVQRRAS